MTMADLMNMYILEHGKIDVSTMGNIVVTYEAVSSITKTSLNKFKKALNEYQYTEFARIEDTAASQNISRTSKVILAEKSKVDAKVKDAASLAEKIYDELTSSTPSLGLSYEDSDSVVTRFAAILKKSKLEDSDIQALNKIWAAFKLNPTKALVSNKAKAVKSAAKEAATKGMKNASSMIGKFANKMRGRHDENT